MKRISFLRIIPYFTLAIVLFSSCKKEEVPVIIPEANEVSKFIWNKLADYYLWNSQVPGLSDPKYADKDSLNAFLNKNTDHQELFTSLLYKYEEVDKWSFLVDNSQTIDDWISGISETMGYDFMLGRIGSSGDIFGVVRYVYKGSPAEKAGVKRGDVFLRINDQQLTTTNYQTLLFATVTYKLGFANIVDNYITTNGREVTMTAIQMQENPISMDTVFIYNNQKIGYLVYNGFNADFDIQLNNVFGKFKDANIEQLIIDLRYNGGGSVQSCSYLASMIYSTDASKIFSKAQYNKGFQAALEQSYGASALTQNFTKTIDATDSNPATPINCLNLNKLYIIASDNTASASEMLINGLRPYMNVRLVGIDTYGKYVASMTIKDINDQGSLNPNHSWAMQPIVAKYANSLDVSDYIYGLAPDIKAEEDFANLLPFGDPNEDLLKVVLADIKGTVVTAKVFKSAKIGMQKIANSHELNPLAKDMYINPIKFRK